MNPKAFYALTAVTVALIGATIALTPEQTTARVAPGQKFFPNMDAKTANTAASLTVTAKAKEFTVYQKDGVWVVKEKADYPADPALVRKAIFALTELRPYEAKTRDPKRWAKLEVEDPKDKDAQSKRLTVNDKDGKVLADVIFGKSNNTNVILGKEMVYVRKAGEDQAWLAEGDPTLKAEPLDWLNRAVADVAADRVREAVTKNLKGDVLLEIAKAKPEDKEFAVKGVPEGRKTKEARTIGYVAEVFEKLNLDDVTKAGDIDFEKNGTAIGTWRTFDGLVITAKMAEQDKKFWVALSAEIDEAALLKEKPKADSKLKDADAVRKEAAEINARVKPWAYSVPSTASRFMQYKLEDVLEEVKKEDKKDEPKKEDVKKEEPKKEEPVKEEPKKEEEKK